RRTPDTGTAHPSWHPNACNCRHNGGCTSSCLKIMAQTPSQQEGSLCAEGTLQPDSVDSKTERLGDFPARTDRLIETGAEGDGREVRNFTVHCDDMRDLRSDCTSLILRMAGAQDDTVQRVAEAPEQFRQ